MKHFVRRAVGIGMYLPGHASGLLSTAVLASCLACDRASAETIPAQTRVLSAESGRAQPHEPKPPSTGMLGSPDPSFVEAAAPDGHWVALCQTRNGRRPDGYFDEDALGLYFIRDSGLGEPLDDFVATDHSGRY